MGFKQLISPAAIPGETPQETNAKGTDERESNFWEGRKSNFALWGERVRNRKTCEQLLMKVEMRVKLRGKGSKCRKEKKKKIPTATEKDKGTIN